VLDGHTDSVIVGAERPVGGATGMLDPNARSGHLAGQIGQAARDIRAMGYDYDADQGLSSDHTIAG
jgi:hypothetical protein